MATKSYHILAHSYQVLCILVHGYWALCKGGLVYQVTTVIQAMKRDVLIPFFPDGIVFSFYFQNPNNPNNLIIDQIKYLINQTRIPF
jgi:hypothetical protein